MNAKHYSILTLAYLTSGVASIAQATGPLGAAALPSSRAGVVGSPTTFFATIINSGEAAALGCSIATGTPMPTVFSYQTTDPQTNQLTGTIDTPVDIAPGAAQSFVVAFVPTNTFAPTTVELVYDCINSSPAPVFQGVNTLLYSASTLPVLDVITVAATAGNTGIVDIPADGGTAAFAVAAMNLGPTEVAMVRVETSGVDVPAKVCQTELTTGQCMNDPDWTTSTQMVSGQPASFSVFLTSDADIPFDPANNRTIVEFVDPTDNVRGATSVATQTIGGGDPVPPIVGRWATNDQTIATLSEDGSYSVLQSESDPDCPMGLERGRYRYDEPWLEVFDITQDDNGDCGLADYGVPYPPLEVWVDGDFLYARDDEDTERLTRIE